MGAYLQQHPGDAGEGRAHLQEQRDHGQVVASLEVDCRAEKPQESKEVVHSQATSLGLTALRPVGSSFPDQGWDPCPLPWKAIS